MPGIFISYRREDSSAYAGRLYDHLVDRFGKDLVFMDVDSIEPGVDFIEVLQNTVGSCDVLIAVIGKHWLMATDEDGRRLDHPEDLVRIEVATALSRNVRVIPALVAGATMPASHELPEALVSLARRNAIEISDTSFVPCLTRLIESLEKILPEDLTTPAIKPHLGTGSAPQTRVPNHAPLSQPAAPPQMVSPMEKIPRWRKWLLLYRPYSFGGIVCRLLFFTTLILDLTATFQTFPQGAYKDGGSWGALGFMILMAFCFSGGAQWSDERAIQKNSFSYGRSN
ncbi:MAG TPA: toll/interleukin-1 receptor domain-containing protein [Terracidiphilus sp.]|jgi:hypothetical protein